jgi:hypothetical protein
MVDKEIRMVLSIYSGSIDAVDEKCLARRRYDGA